MLPRDTPILLFLVPQQLPTVWGAGPPPEWGGILSGTSLLTKSEGVTTRHPVTTAARCRIRSPPPESVQTLIMQVSGASRPGGHFSPGKVSSKVLPLSEPQADPQTMHFLPSHLPLDSQPHLLHLLNQFPLWQLPPQPLHLGTGCPLGCHPSSSPALEAPACRRGQAEYTH